MRCLCQVGFGTRINIDLLRDFLHNFVGDDVKLKVDRDGTVSIVPEEAHDNPYVFATPAEAGSEMRIKTAVGELIAYAGCDPDSPGVGLMYKANGTDSDIDLAYAEVKDPQLLKEGENQRVDLMIWSNPYKEDYVGDPVRYERHAVLEALEADIQTQQVVVPPETAERIRIALDNPDQDHAMGEDESISFTAEFEDGMEADVMVCGVQWDDREPDNSAWAQMVLFKNGTEVACSEVSDTFFGHWELNYDGILYQVDVCETDHD